MAKRRKGLQLPAAYEALKKAKAAGADADTLGAPPTPAEAAAEPGGAQLAAGLTGRRGSSGEAEPAQRDALGAGHVGGPGSPEAGGADGPDEQPPEGDGLRDGSDEPPAKAKAGKGAPVLPWMRLPVSIEPGTGVPLAGVRGLDARLLASLRASGYTELFPVQAAAWQLTAGGRSAAHDLCICAPTGSGKTLAYALPIVAALAGRLVPRLRALVVLPTRDLAAQVFKVFATLAPAVGLRVGLAAAAAPLAAEAAVLATAGFPGLGSDAGDAARAAGGVGFAEDAMLAGQQPGLGLGQGCGGGGGVDVLVATPGRLMAHLRGTPGVTLEHLRFLARARAARAEGLSSAALLEELAGCEHLGHAPAFEHLSASLCGPVPLPIFDLKEVVDETDRLLRQSYQNWLPHVVAAAARPQPAAGLPAAAAAVCSGRVVKVVASATLTRDPAKIERLALHHPRYLALASADHRYALPRELREFKVVCAGADKPLAALALLQALGAERAIVFTGSVQSTQRLSRLLEALPDVAPPAAAFSSADGPAARAAALSAFRSGAARVLVASDALTRGMDVPGVAAVVNYDAPTFAKTYVHRAGRTARAGQQGRVFTLLRPEDVRHFKGLLRKVDNTYVKDFALPAAAMAALRPRVDAALAATLPAAAVPVKRQRGA